MVSIQTSPHPLVFKLGNAAELGFTAPASGGIAIRTWTRSLEGMQKEAIVAYGPTGTAWRMVCDEGPYLNGTDLAPFPLAFFTSGLAADFMSAVLAVLKLRGIEYRDIRLVQDNVYSMQGSAIKGTMTGGALPVSLEVQIDSNAPARDMEEAVTAALASSAAVALLHSSLTSAFSVTVNGEPLPPRRVAALAGKPEPEPGGFDEAVPVGGGEFAADIIEKLESANIVHGVEGGAGSSLTAEQKRTLQIRGICTMREDGMKEIKVQLFKPIGSCFRFLADDGNDAGGRERAPSGLVYLSAGIAFCYMTQLGRYAHIVKKPLQSYRIVQDTCFRSAAQNGESGAEPVKTHVYLGAPEDKDYALTLVDMGEQTCFLHAACRGIVDTRLKVTGGLTE